MIITFTNNNFYRWYAPKAIGPKIPEYSTIKQLRNLLSDKFPSIEFSEFYPEHFLFNDPADEAYFLLWSNEGIEI